MNLFAITNLLCGTFCLMLAIFALIAGKNKTYQRLAWFNFAVSIWGFGTFSVSISQNEAAALMAWKIAHSAGYFIAALFFHLICSLTGIERKRIQAFGYVQAVFFAALTCFTPWLLIETRDYYNFFYAVATPIYAMAVFFYLLFVSLSFIELVKYLKGSDGYKKVQAQYLFYGFFIGFIGGTSLLLPEFYVNVLYPVGNTGVFIYAAIITYAILRDRIFELEHHAQLSHRDKLAAISTLATSINHEIKNPLYIIQGLADSHLSNYEEGIYSNNDKAIEKANAVLKKTRDQAMRAVDIMKRFAMFAKQDVNIQMPSEKARLSEALKTILPLVCHELELDKIKITAEISDQIPLLRVDRRHLEQILFNLVINACQAMKEKEMAGNIEISAEQQNGHVNILVKDTGPGIHSEKLKQVFEPFYTTKEQGTGLGLYITKQLVERNDGKISVDSKLGQGAIFKLEFKR